MTVAELIDKLKALPPNLPAFVFDSEWGRDEFQDPVVQVSDRVYHTPTDRDISCVDIRLGPSRG